MNLDALTKQAISHTLHCLTGCAIGEILGMVGATALKWSNLASIILAIILAFFFGYLLTFYSLRKKQTEVRSAIKTAIATDTTSITSMELIDNAFILVIPGAINANLDTGLFWLSLVTSLVVAFIFTVPVNKWLIGRRSVDHRHHH